MQKYFCIITNTCYTPLVQSTRQQILAYLNTHPAASAVEISRSLDLTAANIRYHLGLLIESGWVQLSGKRGTGGAGRPIKLYNRTSSSLGTNIELLLGAMLESLAAKKSANSNLRSIAETLAAKTNLNPDNRILRFNQALEYLNQLNYHASWEARPDGPQVMLRHCPYRDLAKDHTQLCQFDNHLISILFDTPLELTQKRSFGNNPFSPCIFKPKLG
ncbi:MAG: helix-turn-helix domain-containing protein [Anaerolineales bacterium]|nr:helix-turn-helix domain-containing protein [Anaerolineales bacterium]